MVLATHTAEIEAMEATENKGTLCDCGHVAHGDGFTTGYGRDANGRTSCFACCAQNDRALIERGEVRSVGLYLAGDGGTVTNWPGSAMFYVRESHEYKARGFGGEYTMVSWRGGLTPTCPIVAYGRGPGRGMYTRAKMLKGWKQEARAEVQS